MMYSGIDFKKCILMCIQKTFLYKDLSFLIIENYYIILF